VSQKHILFNSSSVNTDSTSIPRNFVKGLILNKRIMIIESMGSANQIAKEVKFDVIFPNICILLFCFFEKLCFFVFYIDSIYRFYFLLYCYELRLRKNELCTVIETFFPAKMCIDFTCC